VTTLHFLWRNRERPAITSRRWLIVWAKRFINAPFLLRLILDRRLLLMRGARIGRLSVIEGSRFEGPVRNLSVGFGSFIGLGTTFALHDRITVGSCVVINRNVTMLTASHSLKDPHWQRFHRPIVVEDYAWIATGAMLLPGVRIGRGAVVGAGAVVRVDVPAFAVAVGNPATISEAARTETLEYFPTLLVGPLEAWLGREKTPAIPEQWRS
jgi:maltose O-acetyltransferase